MLSAAPVSWLMVSGKPYRRTERQAQAASKLASTRARTNMRLGELKQ